MTIDKFVLIDSHCHPHFPALGDNMPMVVQDMHNHAVQQALAISTCGEDVDKVFQLHRDFPEVFYAACGIHPCNDEAVDMAKLKQWCSPEFVIGVGETGLDYFHNSVDREIQIERFLQHIELANEIRKPLIIHMRESFTDILEVLKANYDLSIGGIMHCFTGDCEQAKQALDINFHISFSGIVSFKKSHELREVARMVPPTRYLVETDSPYLTPVPHRGKTNTPAYVRFVAEAVATARACSLEQVASETTENFRRLFGLPEIDL